MDKIKLSYLLGAFLGDGCAYVGKNSYQFSITSEDYDLCYKVNRICFDLFGLRGRVKSVNNKKGKLSYYQLVVCSKYLVNFVKEITKNKSKFPQFKTTDEKIAFCQGLMDTDGWISLVNAKDGYQRYRVGFKNTALWTSSFRKIISSIGVSTGKLRLQKNNRYGVKNKDSFSFSINSLQYCSKIGFGIKRKVALTQRCLEHYAKSSKKRLAHSKAR